MEHVEHALARLCARARPLGAVLGVETVHPDIEEIRAAIGAAVGQAAEAERRRRAVRRRDADVRLRDLDGEVRVARQRAVRIGEGPRARPADVGERRGGRLWRHVACPSPVVERLARGSGEQSSGRARSA